MNPPSHSSLLAITLVSLIGFVGRNALGSPRSTPSPTAQTIISQASPSAVGAATAQAEALASKPSDLINPKSETTKAPTESFSQLTLFLFASGLALFIALLGWSDQIRGIDKDTRELEERFLKKTGINKSHFVEIVKSGEPDKQLLALTQAVNDGKIMSNVSVEVLESFDNYMTKLRPLERLSDRKYTMTVALTIALFGSGTASLFTNPTQTFFSIRVEMLILVVPMIFIATLLVIIILSAKKEKVLRSILNSMSDMV